MVAKKNLVQCWPLLSPQGENNTKRKQGEKKSAQGEKYYPAPEWPGRIIPERAQRVDEEVTSSSRTTAGRPRGDFGWTALAAGAVVRARLCFQKRLRQPACVGPGWGTWNAAGRGFREENYRAVPMVLRAGVFAANCVHKTLVKTGSRGLLYDVRVLSARGGTALRCPGQHLLQLLAEKYFAYSLWRLTSRRPRNSRAP